MADLSNIRSRPGMGPSEYTPIQERNMRKRSAAERADPAVLGQVDPTFEPDAAQDARDAAASRMRK